MIARLTNGHLLAISYRKLSLQVVHPTGADKLGAPCVTGGQGEDMSKDLLTPDSHLRCGEESIQIAAHALEHIWAVHTLILVRPLPYLGREVD